MASSMPPQRRYDADYLLHRHDQDYASSLNKLSSREERMAVKSLPAIPEHRPVNHKSKDRDADDSYDPFALLRGKKKRARFTIHQVHRDKVGEVLTPFRNGVIQLEEEMTYECVCRLVDGLIAKHRGRKTVSSRAFVNLWMNLEYPPGRMDAVAEYWEVDAESRRMRITKANWGVRRAQLVMDSKVQISFAFEVVEPKGSGEVKTKARVGVQTKTTAPTTTTVVARCLAKLNKTFGHCKLEDAVATTASVAAQ